MVWLLVGLVRNVLKQTSVSYVVPCPGVEVSDTHTIIHAIPYVSLSAAGSEKAWQENGGRKMCSDFPADKR